MLCECEGEREREREGVGGEAWIRLNEGMCFANILPTSKMMDNIYNLSITIGSLTTV